jgi:hypothetical protein
VGDSGPVEDGIIQRLAHTEAELTQLRQKAG